MATVSEISEKINEGIFLISVKRGRSEVWTSFGEICDSYGEKISGFVCCRDCKEVLKKFGASTTNLRNHKCFKSLKDDSDVEEITAAQRKEIKKIVVDWCISDIIPFEKVGSENFINLIETVINTVQQHKKKIEATDMIPSPSTISRAVDERYDDRKNYLKRELSEIDSFSITTDMWSDDHKRSSFLAITCHYFDNNDVLIERLLSVNHFDKRSTSVNIRSVVSESLEDFGLSIDSATIITDRGSNMVCAFKEDDWLNCIDHFLNNVLENATKDLPELKKILSDCSGLVRFFKKSSNLMDKLETTLKSASPTRWNSKYFMLKSIADNFNEIRAVLTEKGLENKLEGINPEIIKRISAFLEKFKSMSDIFETTKKPSIHMVIPGMNDLRKSCIASMTDPKIVMDYKSNVEKLIQSWKPHMYHKSALLLFPHTKKLTKFSNDEKREIFDFLKSINDKNSPRSTVSSILSSCDSMPAASNQIDLPSFFDEYVDESVSDVATFDDELQSYIDEPVIKSYTIEEYWKLKKNTFPSLYKIFKKVCSIPPTSAASERVFSYAGLVYSSRRPNLNADKLSKSLFLKINGCCNTSETLAETSINVEN